ncbi:MAG TPA: helix-turn-helix transcriptional regulator, partial [Ornithinibacter sp.]|nr:helix-turn-helix transcriptional regulator [Ornithinibacter sp.]
WATAHARLAALDTAELDDDDLLALGTASFMAGDRDACARALEEAYRRHVDRGEVLAAVRDTFWLGLLHDSVGDAAVGGGWVARGARLLQDADPDAVEHGYLAVHEMYRHIGAGEYPAALELATRVTQTGRRHHDANLIAMGLSSEGRLLIYGGRVREGLALLDEAMAGLSDAGISPVLAGNVYCSMVEACQEVADYRRMAEWTTALTRWCSAQPELVPFTGQCAVHRAQIMRSRGALSEALDELALAVSRYTAEGGSPAAGLALYERGEVLRVRGDHAGAAAAFAEAAAFGRDPQPGQSLLALAQGRGAAAAAMVRRLLDETPDPVHRSAHLPAAVEVFLAVGDVDAARAAADELTTLAADFGCQALDAAGAFAVGSVALAPGGPEAAADALPHLRHAWTLWIDLGARYEAAWARVRIGLACRALGDEESALSDFGVAGRTFAELGAAPALAEVDRLVGRDLPDGLTAREVEVLRLVASGQSNPQIASALFLSQKTVQRHLSNIFAKTGVTSRTAAAAYAFEHRLT